MLESEILGWREELMCVCSRTIKWFRQAQGQGRAKEPEVRGGDLHSG